MPETDVPEHMTLELLDRFGKAWNAREDARRRRDPVLHGGGRLVLVLRGNRLPSRRARGRHVATLGARWAALEPIRQGVRHAFGAFGKGIARGLKLRCDWGPQYIAGAWIQEVQWLGIAISPTSVGEPECNGVIERFIRRLKEQCPVPASLHDPGGGPADHRGVPRALPHRVAHRAARLPNAGPGPRRRLEGHHMRTRPVTPKWEGRIGPRIAFDEGRYLGTPEIGLLRPSRVSKEPGAVQETGQGALRTNMSMLAGVARERDGRRPARRRTAWPSPP